jgi:hypothetical protein
MRGTETESERKIERENYIHYYLCATLAIWHLDILNCEGASHLKDLHLYFKHFNISLPQLPYNLQVTF